MFYDDWHIAQMIGFFLYPLVALYRAIVGSNDGIVLGFRYFYIIYTMFVGLCFYLKFKDEYGFYAIMASSIYMLFTPFNIMALSYNTMSVGFLLLALMCYKKYDLFRLYISGFLYGCAVINTPYLAFGYLFLIYLVIKKKDYFNNKDFISLTCGIATIAIIFIAFALSRASITQIMSCLKFLIDPSHDSSVFKWFAFNGYKLILNLNIDFAVLGFEIIYAFKYRKNYKKKKVLELSYLITLISVLYVAYINPSEMDKGGYVLIFIPVFLLGFIIILCKEFDSYLEFIFAVSVFHAFLIAISSNVGPRSFSAPLVVACMVTVLMFKNVDFKPCSKVVFLTIFIASLVYFKIFNVFEGSNDYSYMIEKGPLKGLYDSEAKVTDYYFILDDVDYINTLDGDYVAFISWKKTWMYLATDKVCGFNSTYIYFYLEEEYENCVDEYRNIHPEKEVWIYLDNSSAYDIREDNPWMQQFMKVRDLKHGILFR